ncbi:MAG: heme exporter protein CcmB [Gammaproteobacteria bacterium]|jgi:heme exporter protein B|nr:heme exporter protein CcmB [Gammaproteobacteria bacterium]|tara:strand:- start:11775 stop:12437 length:663 start_codon:yes stop_codon:yes gene_type:complete
MIKNLIKKELIVYFRNLNNIFLPLIFFFLIISIFPLVLGPDKSLFNDIIPGVIWITAILTTLLSSNNFFRDDHSNGVIEMYLTSNAAVELILFLRIISCWLFTCLPIILFMPLVSILFSISFRDSLVILITLLVGTPILISIGIFGSALTLGLAKNNILTPIIVIPFYIPVLIFSASAIESVSAGLPYDMQLYILIALLFLILPIMPYLLKYTLRLSINN